MSVWQRAYGKFRNTTCQNNASSTATTGQEKCILMPGALRRFTYNVLQRYFLINRTIIRRQFGGNAYRRSRNLQRSSVYRDKERISGDIPPIRTTKVSVPSTSFYHKPPRFRHSGVTIFCHEVNGTSQSTPKFKFEK